MSGSSGLYYLGVSFLAFAALFLAVLVYSLIHGPAARLKLFLAVPVMLGVSGGFVKQGKAKDYDPEKLPESLLPPG